ncbi:putative BOI-related E3 ubiquitin-protein ligase 2 [Carex littledalei]|uniref:Putative BOI-related E3 ubiquitin-protein ligase 2 n=1 Tax=Carex littledalei TaxID=544730 RepID=A0A833R771_9POAL|nr:putative BOI-related E3 ubiquitin-protein ligase 2 [Carex littledalei]
MPVKRNKQPKKALPNDFGWQRRVGCKRSTPNPMISLPLKKRKMDLLGETIQEGSHGDIFSYEDQKENIIPDQEPKKEATAGGINAEAVDSTLKELRINQEDMIPDLKNERTTAEAGNSYFTDSKEQKVIAEEEEPKKGAIPVSVNKNCSIEGGDSYLPDSRTQGKTIVGSNDEELASDAESRADTVSRADRWACRVCKEAVVSIAVLPCSHLCLCWDCEFEIDHCPVCGEPKTGCFYIRSP